MLAIAGALFCVLANAFFVAAEFSLAKVRSTSLEARAKAGDAAAERALRVQKRLDEFLPATQLGITLASLGLGSVGEDAFTGIFRPMLLFFHVPETAAEEASVAIGFGLISALHIVVGELVPKALAIQRPEDVARYSAGVLRVFYYAVWPALVVLNVASKLVLRMLRMPAPDHAEGKLSLEELRLLIQASVPEDEGHKRELLERVLRATDRPVRAIMVPRIDMEILSMKAPIEAWRTRIQQQGYSRYPLSSDDNPDHVVGYVYVKDLLFGDAARLDPKTLRRDILIVPEGRTVGELLQEFQRTKIPIALVVDEYGGTAGLVTLEDAIAEIVGHIGDETTEEEQPKVRRDEDGSVVVDGRLPVGDLELEGTPLPEHDAADTVGGLVVASLGRLASPGDLITLGSWEGVVEDVRARRVHRVRFRKTEKGATTKSGEGAAQSGADI
jgi:CBS domain containing-hemolysin-like protein